MKKLLIVFLCCTVLLIGCGTIADTAESGIGTDAETNKNSTITFENIGKNNNIFASYDKGYDSVDELMDVATIIVRATPTEVEYESDVAICWILQIAESNKEGLSEIRLRQLKDEYLLNIGEEVVLVLQPDASAEYYNIPGGGSGLFRVDKETKSVYGVLLESLIDSCSSTYSSKPVSELTLSMVFDMLTEQS